VTTIQEKLNAFADAQKQILTTNSDVDNTLTVSTEHVVNDFLKQPLIDRARTTNRSETASIVRHFKTRKAAEPDRIQNEILQHLSQLVLKCIAKVVNRSLALTCFPTQWKYATIIMLPKPDKDHTPPLKYRPVSLLNSLRKLFEKIILKRLNFQLRELKVVRNDKCGFRRGHTTTHALLRKVERITHGFNNGKAAVALFPGIERAFDKI
jgi:hypothetical protein